MSYSKHVLRGGLAEDGKFGDVRRRSGLILGDHLDVSLVAGSAVVYEQGRRHLLHFLDSFDRDPVLRHQLGVVLKPAVQLTHQT